MDTYETMWQLVLQDVNTLLIPSGPWTGLMGKHFMNIVRILEGL